MLKSRLHRSDNFSQEEQNGLLRVALIGVSEDIRDVVTQALPRTLCLVWTPFVNYPRPAEIPHVASLGYDIFIVNMDTDPEYALLVVEGLSKQKSATVMGISEQASAELVIRSVRAGAHEFFTLPLDQEQIKEALARADDRKAADQRGPLGQLCVFIGAKGGTGTTTVATNFAIAAAQELQGNVLLIDLDLPLGDAVLNFGLKPDYSTMDPLTNYDRLDFNLLSRYLVKHDSGISILAAPGRFVACPISREALDKVIQTARQGFDCVVVDAGCRFDLVDSVLFGAQAHMYLVLQMTIADLRNANRIVSEHLVSRVAKFDLVLNRCSSRSAIQFDDAQLEKALNHAPKWRIPNDYAAVCKMQTTATPLVMKKSPITRALRNMARAGLSLPRDPEKKGWPMRLPNGVLSSIFRREKTAN